MTLKASSDEGSQNEASKVENRRGMMRENEVINKAVIKREVNWPNVLLFIYLHLSGLYGLFLVFTEAQLKTTMFAFSIVLAATLGMTAGAHRLWAHRTYTASLPLRIMLLGCHTLVGQGSLYEWVRDHRLHHLYFGTKLDPYGVHKGFLHSHFGCHLVQRHPETNELYKQIDMSDLENDSLIMFQKRFKWMLIAVFCFLLPINAPIEYWNESIVVSFFVVGSLRFALTTNISWLINSSFNIWGLREGERYPPGDNNMIFLVNKTFWPAYHYLVPSDYRCGEFGGYGNGITTAFIHTHLRIGSASKAKTTNSAITKDALKLARQSGSPLQQCFKDVMSKIT